MSRTPTAFEQAMLEYVNLARMDPSGEFDRMVADAEAGAGVQANITSAISYFGVDLEAFRTQMEAFDPVAPLAWSGELSTAALAHSEAMVEQDTQSHYLPGEASLGARITDAGYTGWSNLGENIYAYAEDPLFAHAGFMIDWGYDDADIEGGVLRSDWKTAGDGIQDGAGHRVTIMSERYTDIGIGVVADTDSSTSVGPYVLTQDFGATQVTSSAMLLGVFIDDADGDRFYDIGEGMGGITVTASSTAGTFTTTTWDAGGYQMELAPSDYTLRFSGSSIEGSASYEVTVGTHNVKIDGTTADLQTDAAPATASTDDAPVVAVYPDVAAQVYRLYKAVLGREPDAEGHENWTARIAVEGMDVTTVAEMFMNSEEFQQSYGGLDSSGFVELLYMNVLGREADENGLARWTGDIDSGVPTAQVVLGFSDSAEFINSTADAAATFITGPSTISWGDDVYRLYQATLDRAPDLTGFTNWAERLGSGMSFEEVADSFVRSPEFVATYDSLDNGAFVELLYANVLDRAADAMGLTNWTERLEDGMTRAEVVEGFSQSAEFVAATDDDFADWVRAQGTDDTLLAGGGNTALSGGLLSDTFVFALASGDSTVLDLEVWDTIDLSAMGYASEADARADFSQQGADVIFDNNAGTTVVLLDAELSWLSDEMILI